MSTNTNSLDDLKSAAVDGGEVPKDSQTTYTPFFKRVLAQKQGKIGLITDHHRPPPGLLRAAAAALGDRQHGN